MLLVCSLSSPEAMALEILLQVIYERNNAILNLSLIVEVLSPSTERGDRGEKFRKSRSLPILQDYLLISPEEPDIKHYCQTDAAARIFTS